MRLKPDFITQDIDGTQFLVPIGGSTINGLARSNRTAAFIVDQLKAETTPEAIVDAMCAKYDADRIYFGNSDSGIRRLGKLNNPDIRHGIGVAVQNLDGHFLHPVFVHHDFFRACAVYKYAEVISLRT